MRAATCISSLVAICGLAVAAVPASADSRDIDPLAVPVGECLAPAPDVGLAAQPGSGTNDGAVPHICRADMPRPVTFQGSTGEWMVFRIGDLEATLADCQAFEANTTVTYALDGQAVDTDHLPCQVRTDGNWFTDYRFLSHPLVPGLHSVAVTFTSAGGSTTLLRGVTVMSNG
jgi:hypothetical protein